MGIDGTINDHRPCARPERRAGSRAGGAHGRAPQRIPFTLERTFGGSIVGDLGGRRCWLGRGLVEGDRVGAEAARRRGLSERSERRSKGEPPRALGFCVFSVSFVVIRCVL